ncbi:unnamed protein product [Rhizoctonia solani]|uniref:Uncharacterized protein n=1 Tax=Rhizoctonia solani TaxID=456999 RepID=A0A8H3AHR0_9AGAM|nr:unnamed protein product [Rhizoctonia solani]
MCPMSEIKTFWAYVCTDEELTYFAQHPRFSGRHPPISEDILAPFVYSRLKRHGPVRLYEVAIGKGYGTMITVGYPNQDFQDLPPRLLKRATLIFRSPPLLVTQEGEFYEFKIPAVDGKGFDRVEIDIYTHERQLRAEKDFHSMFSVANSALITLKQPALRSARLRHCRAMLRASRRCRSWG